MARLILTAVMIVMLNVLVGCGQIDSGRSQLVTMDPMMRIAAAPALADATETDVVEQVAINRRAYRGALESLAAYYAREADHMKLDWAQKELGALDAMPQYKYIVEAGMAGSDLRATTPIAEADYLYRSARELEDKAGLILKDEDMLRLALDKYNQLIRQFPSSDKIDDAAYRAGLICEHFKDYSIALLYYQRTFQWDPHTTYPARFREGYVLDQHLHERARALQAYERALKSLRDENEHINWRNYAEKRVGELTKAELEGK